MDPIKFITDRYHPPEQPMPLLFHPSQLADLIELAVKPYRQAIKQMCTVVEEGDQNRIADVVAKHKHLGEKSG